ncbi:hypothetical protein EPR50_G00181350 [Perca flavescens]|uniref:Uncharacterized protein n=1 Tax=Perca flavescens TaxID=8167 RepID=A0A484CHT9_PERFV|nr:hypothetical protein EPR50_G00181350 [Perca flavescens]
MSLIYLAAKTSGTAPRTRLPLLEVLCPADFLLLDTFTAARLLRPESSGEGKRNKTSDLDWPPVPSSCSIGGNRTTGLSWVEQ